MEEVENSHLDSNVAEEFPHRIRLWVSGPVDFRLLALDQFSIRSIGGYEIFLSGGTLVEDQRADAWESESKIQPLVWRVTKDSLT